MPRMGFEPATPAFEREKTIHVLDRAATVIGSVIHPERSRRLSLLTQRYIYMDDFMKLSLYTWAWGATSHLPRPLFEWF
jgi:hypothetical protein